jgi:hypothetical protein
MWAEIQETLSNLDLALSEAKARGLEYSRAEAAYYSAKDRRVRELMDEGLSATAISLVIKGEESVNDKLQHFRNMEVLYKNALEAVNTYKLRLRVLENQFEREWGQTKRL